MKMYRIEFEYANGRKRFWGYVDWDPKEIEKAMANNIKGSPVVNIYTKTGKKIIYSFQG